MSYKNKYPDRRKGSRRKNERIHCLADTTASVALIVLCCAALLYLLVHPEVPAELKAWVNDHWDDVRDVLTFRNYPIQGFFQQTWGRKFSTIIGDMLLIIVLLPIFQILLILTWPLQLLLPSVVRITPYALPVFTIIVQVNNILSAWKRK